MKVCYIRVSTIEQNEARQKEAMQGKGIEKYYIEKVSAKDTNRPKLQEMLDYVREGDIIYIHDFSRLARSTKDLLDIVELLNKKGVILKSNKENLDTSTPTGKLMLTMIGAINEFERQNLLERQREGIAIAKREGKFRGGQVKEISEERFAEAYADYKERNISKSQLAERLEISRPTLNKLLKDKGLEQSRGDRPSSNNFEKYKNFIYNVREEKRWIWKDQVFIYICRNNKKKAKVKKGTITTATQKAINIWRESRPRNPEKQNKSILNPETMRGYTYIQINNKKAYIGFFICLRTLKN